MPTPLFGLRNSVVRRAVLRLFRTVNPGDVAIRHHWVGKPLRLHSFKHKGYWWHGKRREQETINRFHSLIRPGDVVIEVGGHIGYFTMIYGQLVGDNGLVCVFEPGENNLPYIRKNIAAFPNVKLVEKAASDTEGAVTFWLEDLSGQNNSIIENYHLLDGNIQLSGLGEGVHKRAVTIPCTTLDAFSADPLLEGRPVNFIKIDVEGAELLVLKGASALLKSMRPVMMVEVTREAEEIFSLLTRLNYRLELADGTPVASSEQMNGNVFCFPA
ncbi:FkbM family methyltransferase [Brevundimonas sp. BR2-1]|uniref:FkbM family methyltransferase n=1 Tax=Brevundimonas sp. BR2-1 TaxID=3031123 RepID=UPI0030B7EC21